MSAVSMRTPTLAILLSWNRNSRFVEIVRLKRRTPVFSCKIWAVWADGRADEERLRLTAAVPQGIDVLERGSPASQFHSS